MKHSSLRRPRAGATALCMKHSRVAWRCAGTLALCMKHSSGWHAHGTLEPECVTHRPGAVSA
eukprot:9273304-Alexandrium_andersonii.AAC.1